MTTSTATATRPFEHIDGAKYVVLTTFRRDGTPVPTPVHVVAHGDVAYVRTFEPSGKVKRIRRNPDVEVAPGTLRGRPTGEARPARARFLTGDEAAAAAYAPGRKHRFVHGWMIPWYHRRTGRTTLHLELRPR